MKWWTVLVLDDCKSLVRVSRDVGRRAHHGFQPDPGLQRIRRQRLSRVAGGEERLEALSIRGPLDVGGQLVRHLAGWLCGARDVYGVQWPNGARGFQSGMLG